VGRIRTVLGCRNPDRQVSTAGCSELLPRPFGVGEPVAYVQAPKAKGHRSLSIGFRTPRPRVIGLFAGAHRRCSLTTLGEEYAEPVYPLCPDRILSL
jgi:hypothetical protein